MQISCLQPTSRGGEGGGGVGVEVGGCHTHSSKRMCRVECWPLENVDTPVVMVLPPPCSVIPSSWWCDSTKPTVAIYRNQSVITIIAPVIMKVQDFFLCSALEIVCP